MSAFTKAAIFQPGTTTRMMARFSTVAGERGSPDMWRDLRGFALKFYTSEGNYDLVGNDTPVFFVKDPIHMRTAYERHAEDDDWSQPGPLVRGVLDDAGRDRLVSNIVGQLRNGVTSTLPDGRNQ